MIDNIEKQINELNKEIEEKQKEVTLLKKELSSYNKYRNFDFEKYKKFTTKLCPGRHPLNNEALLTKIRELARKLATCHIKDGSCHFKSADKKADLLPHQIKICNDFIDELYPLIVKYTIMAIEHNNGYRAKYRRMEQPDYEG